MKGPTIIPIAYSNTQAAVLICILVHGGDDDPKQHESQNATLFEAVLDCKGRRPAFRHGKSAVCSIACRGNRPVAELPGAITAD